MDERRLDRSSASGHQGGAGVRGGVAAGECGVGAEWQLEIGVASKAHHPFYSIVRECLPLTPSLDHMSRFQSPFNTRSVWS